MTEKDQRDRTQFLFHCHRKRQDVIQASWMLQCMLGDDRKRFTEKEEEDIAKTFEDIAKVMRSSSSSGTKFEDKVQ